MSAIPQEGSREAVGLHPETLGQLSEDILLHLDFLTLANFAEVSGEPRFRRANVKYPFGQGSSWLSVEVKPLLETPISFWMLLAKRTDDSLAVQDTSQFYNPDSPEARYQFEARHLGWLENGTYKILGSLYLEFSRPLGDVGPILKTTNGVFGYQQSHVIPADEIIDSTPYRTIHDMRDELAREAGALVDLSLDRIMPA